MRVLLAVAIFISSSYGTYHHRYIIPVTEEVEIPDTDVEDVVAVDDGERKHSDTKQPTILLDGQDKTPLGVPSALLPIVVGVPVVPESHPSHATAPLHTIGHHSQSSPLVTFGHPWQYPGETYIVNELWGAGAHGSVSVKPWGPQGHQIRGPHFVPHGWPVVVNEPHQPVYPLVSGGLGTENLFHPWSDIHQILEPVLVAESSDVSNHGLPVEKDPHHPHIPVASAPSGLELFHPWSDHNQIPEPVVNGEGSYVHNHVTPVLEEQPHELFHPWSDHNQIPESVVNGEGSYVHNHVTPVLEEQPHELFHPWSDHNQIPEPVVNGEGSYVHNHVAPVLEEEPHYHPYNPVVSATSESGLFYPWSIINQTPEPEIVGEGSYISNHGHPIVEKVPHHPHNHLVSTGSGSELFYPWSNVHHIPVPVVDGESPYVSHHGLPVPDKDSHYPHTHLVSAESESGIFYHLSGINKIPGPIVVGTSSFNGNHHKPTAENKPHQHHHLSSTGQVFIQHGPPHGEHVPGHVVDEGAHVVDCFKPVDDKGPHHLHYPLSSTLPHGQHDGDASNVVEHHKPGVNNVPQHPHHTFVSAGPSKPEHHEQEPLVVSGSSHILEHHKPSVGKEPNSQYSLKPSEQHEIAISVESHKRSPVGHPSLLGGDNTHNLLGTVGHGSPVYQLWIPGSHKIPTSSLSGVTPTTYHLGFGSSASHQTFGAQGHGSHAYYTFPLGHGIPNSAAGGINSISHHLKPGSVSSGSHTLHLLEQHGEKIFPSGEEKGGPTPNQPLGTANDGPNSPLGSEDQRPPTLQEWGPGEQDIPISVGNGSPILEPFHPVGEEPNLPLGPEEQGPPNVQSPGGQIIPLPVDQGSPIIISPQRPDNEGPSKPVEIGGQGSSVLIPPNPGNEESIKPVGIAGDEVSPFAQPPRPGNDGPITSIKTEEQGSPVLQPWLSGNEGLLGSVGIKGGQGSPVLQSWKPDNEGPFNSVDTEGGQGSSGLHSWRPGNEGPLNFVGTNDQISLPVDLGSPIIISPQRPSHEEPLQHLVPGQQGSHFLHPWIPDNEGLINYEGAGGHGSPVLLSLKPSGEGPFYSVSTVGHATPIVHPWIPGGHDIPTSVAHVHGSPIVQLLTHGVEKPHRPVGSTILQTYKPNAHHTPLFYGVGSSNTIHSGSHVFQTLGPLNKQQPVGSIVEVLQPLETLLQQVPTAAQNILGTIIPVLTGQTSTGVQTDGSEGQTEVQLVNEVIQLLQPLLTNSRTHADVKKDAKESKEE